MENYYPQSPEEAEGHETEVRQIKTYGGITAEEIAEIVSRVIGSMRIYVVESDITDAQNRVRAIVDEATF